MKIAFFANTFPSLSETFILSQIVGLLQRGHDLEIEANRPQDYSAAVFAEVERFGLLKRTHYREPMPGALPARLRSAVSRVVRWGWRHPASTLDSLNFFRHGRKALSLELVHERLPTRCSQRGYDIIHCHFGPNGQRATALRAAGTLRGKIVTTFYGYDANLWPRLHGPDVYRDLFERGDLYTVGSEFLRRKIVSLGAPPDRIVKLPMGVDLSLFKSGDRSKRKAGEFRLLTVARLVEVKGIEHALRAVALVKDRFPGIRYFIAGDGPLRAPLTALSEELGLSAVVTFLGAVTETEKLRQYADADAFVLPSIVTASGEEDSQPVVLAEAQASGLPVVATNIGGIPESIREGESGLLVPPGDPEALGVAVGWLADHTDAWDRMGRAGRAHAAEHYDRERLLDRQVEIYNGLCAPAAA